MNGDQRVECGVVFEAPPSWQYGSYCSGACGSLDLGAVLVSAAGADVQSSDDGGMNAFQRRRIQRDANEASPQQQGD